MGNTIEQQKCLELFSEGGNLRISAYAGSGKTSTLKLLAEATPRKGLYMAYNKAISKEAGEAFPERVSCATSHAIAFKAVRTSHEFSKGKMNDTANAHRIADLLDLPSMQISKQCVIRRISYGAFLRQACDQFLASADETPSIQHFPRNLGVLSALSDEHFRLFASEALSQLKQLWLLMCDPASRIPLGHDGYLKLWALSNPKLSADYILLDEAQDSNPAILKVLAAQKCQVVYVGDPYQQIYEWRGAVDAMSRVQTQNQTLLSKSFRFGPRIAEAATKIIAGLGATTAVVGNDALDSHLADVHPDAILCRGNAGLIGCLLTLLADNVRCCVVGGTGDLQNLLHDVSRLKQGTPSMRRDLFGFQSWSEVQQHSQDFEDANLKKIVKLVDDYGEERLLAAFGRCETEEKRAQVVLSTAHKAKGRQWDYVEIDRDFAKAFNQFEASSVKAPAALADIRLLYVAITRARLAVSVPSTIRDAFHLENSTGMRQGPNKGFSTKIDEIIPDHSVWRSRPIAAAPGELGVLPVSKIGVSKLPQTTAPDKALPDSETAYKMLCQRVQEFRLFMAGLR